MASPRLQVIDGGRTGGQRRGRTAASLDDLDRQYRRFKRRDRVRKLLVIALAVTMLGGLASWNLSQSAWSSSTKLRHIAAAPNCDAARAVGLATARRGQPGYYPSHDADNDGIACERYRGW